MQDKPGHLPIRHMFDRSREAIAMAAGISFVDFRQDRKMNLALTRLIEMIGQSAEQVPAEFRERHAQVNWQWYVDTQNDLLRHYDAVDFSGLLKITQNELPKLINQLEKIVAEEMS